MRRILSAIFRKLKIRWLSKYIKFFIKIYLYFTHLFIRFLSLFIYPDSKRFLFISYEGKKFDDSPKAIFDFVYNDSRFENMKFAWAFSNPSNFDLPEDVEKIKIYSFKFYIITLKSKFIVSNAKFASSINFKGRGSIYYNSWHGSAIKTIGIDRNPKSNNFNPHGTCVVDLMSGQSQYDIDTFSRVYNIPKERFILSGLPRNDELCNPDNDKINAIKRKLNIDNDKKVILYAPTYRNYNQNKQLYYVENSQFDFEKWKEVLGNEYVILFRSHYYINNENDNEQADKFVINVTDYPYINDLLIACDILISDYSSVLFDYSITGKPMICYPYDLEEYMEKVGIYLDLGKEMPCGIVKTQDELLTRISNMDYNLEMTETVKFRNKYIKEYGNATKIVVEHLSSLQRGENK